MAKKMLAYICKQWPVNWGVGEKLLSSFVLFFSSYGSLQTLAMCHGVCFHWFDWVQVWLKVVDHNYSPVNSKQRIEQACILSTEIVEWRHFCQLTIEIWSINKVLKQLRTYIFFFTYVTWMRKCQRGYGNRKWRQKRFTWGSAVEKVLGSSRMRSRIR